ncbi:MAG TPA: hypothetical protein ENI73_10570 [Spirochaetes bacterium]|nr:hypothetical protein [Spirochaetota bacterium]
MTKKEVLNEINKFSFEERLSLLESALHNLLEDYNGKLPDRSNNDLLKKGAEALLKDYEYNSELTPFTALDHEDFHA